MAAPSTVTMKAFNGEFTLNKKLSSNSEALLSLQGVPFIARKAIGHATVSLNVKTSSSGSGKIQIKTLIGGKETSEPEVINPNNAPAKAEHQAFGEVTRQARYTTSASDLQTALTEATAGSELAPTSAEDAEDAKYLASGWGEKGFSEGVLCLTVISAKKGWVHRNAWGFMEVDGERKYVRLTLIRKGGKREVGKNIYDFGAK